MKKILVIGKNSYIGLAFKKWVEEQKKDWFVTCISSRNEEWKNENFGAYDSVLHVAGIAHVDAKADMEQMYYQVNRDLTIACCEKAKKDGCRQFVFLSSIIVYGESRSLRPTRITKDTKPCPNGFYGQSKLEAEQGILPMATDTFKVAVVRPPMVYGKGSKGNYPKLAKFAACMPLFPNMKNERSMIHIDNLTECIRLIIEHQAGGIFYPQNKEYVCTAELVKEIAHVKGKNVHLTKLGNPFFKLLGNQITIVSKLFGSLTYDKALSSHFGWEYCVCDFKESIKRTEQK